MLIPAIIFITLALIFYSIGVWSEKAQKTLKKWHVSSFWLGFICDTTGTALMGVIASQTNTAPNPFHAITGYLAILLMAFHAIWATIVLVRNNEKLKQSFHKFSILAWFIWLIPYLSGMILGMSK